VLAAMEAERLAGDQFVGGLLVLVAGMLEQFAPG
jgi:hypothetical protein